MAHLMISKNIVPLVKRSFMNFKYFWSLVVSMRIQAMPHAPQFIFKMFGLSESKFARAVYEVNPVLEPENSSGRSGVQSSGGILFQKKRCWGSNIGFGAENIWVT